MFFLISNLGLGIDISSIVNQLCDHLLLSSQRSNVEGSVAFLHRNRQKKGYKNKTKAYDWTEG